MGCASVCSNSGPTVFAMTVLFLTLVGIEAAVGLSKEFTKQFHVKASSTWSHSAATGEEASSSSSAWPDPDDPPKWPNVFQVQFQEILNLGAITLSKNNGTWYYDFDSLTARFDHSRGQKNNFCQGQGLSPKDPKADCHLLFTKPGDLWVIYPGAQTCCRLCGTAQGCTILKPDWLNGSKLTETINIGGRPCAGWAKRGAVAAADTWYVDQQGVPCRYHEVVDFINHNLTFVPSSYSPTHPIPPSVFRVPSYCKDTCPHPYPQPPH
ncbi:uncharacterized protein LOC143298922 [Babylonia areolata]|uniref:uncharacterized protein LOC143298922 n=1 Tax=Babylonia areolata TaxID=304850 RepID=UPI003FD1B716